MKIRKSHKVRGLGRFNCKFLAASRLIHAAARFEFIPALADVDPACTASQVRFTIERQIIRSTTWPRLPKNYSSTVLIHCVERLITHLMRAYSSAYSAESGARSDQPRYPWRALQLPKSTHSVS